MDSTRDMERWYGLPSDLVRLIAERLPREDDFTRLAAVCKPWSAALVGSRLSRIFYPQHRLVIVDYFPADVDAEGKVTPRGRRLLSDADQSTEQFYFGSVRLFVDSDQETGHGHDVESRFFSWSCTKCNTAPSVLRRSIGGVEPIIRLSHRFIKHSTQRPEDSEKCVRSSWNDPFPYSPQLNISVILMYEKEVKVFGHEAIEQIRVYARSCHKCESIHYYLMDRDVRDPMNWDIMNHYCYTDPLNSGGSIGTVPLADDEEDDFDLALALRETIDGGGLASAIQEIFEVGDANVFGPDGAVVEEEEGEGADDDGTVPALAVQEAAVDAGGANVARTGGFLVPAAIFVPAAILVLGVVDIVVGVMSSRKKYGC